MNEFTIVDYFDVYEDSEGCYQVNNIARTDYKFTLAESDGDNVLVDKLKEVGYLNNDVSIDDLYIEWLDDYYCEISNAEDLYPICRIEKLVYDTAIF